MSGTSVGNSGPAAPIDLTRCDREPVHAPNQIQPFGAVVVASRGDRRILQASANLGQWARPGADAALGRDLAVVVTSERADEIARLAAEGCLEGNPLLMGTMNLGAPIGPVAVTAHTNGTQLLVELEPSDGTGEGGGDAGGYASLEHVLCRLHGTFGVSAFCDRLADEVRRLTGFDRVMIYRFHPDQSGEVAAESLRAGLPPYLGLRYPAGDIPLSTRKLFLASWVRTVPDIHRPAVPLVAVTSDADPADLTWCFLRGVSPLHVEYLTNMGVTATLTLALVRGKELWGLVACHHGSPRRLPIGVRTACVILAQVASLRLAEAEEREGQRYREAVRAAHDGMLARAAGESVSLSTLVDGEPGLLDLVPAAGVALRVDGRWVVRGQTPSVEALEGLARWLADAHPQEEVFAIDSLAATYPPAAAGEGGIAGVLAGRLTPDPGDLLLWFRPETARTVHWAGDPNDKPVVSGPHGPRLHPRKSFEVWKESVRGRSAPWSPAEVDAVRQFLRAVREVLFATQRERLAQVTTLLQAVVSGTTDAVYVKDRSGQYLLLNEAAARFVGKPAAEVLGQDDRALFDPDSARRIREWDQRILTTGVAETLEEEVTVAGITWTFHTTKAPYRDTAGAVVGVIGISRDITSRKETERQLRAERDRFEKLVETNPLAICSFQVRPDGSTCFPYASPRIEPIYGLSPAELARDAGPIFALIHPEDVARVRDSVGHSSRTFSVWRTEYRVRKTGREEIWVEGCSAPTRGADGSTVWHGYIADVTDRKRAEEEIRRARELLRLILDTVPTGVFWKDRQSRHLGCNAVVARALGFASPDAVVGLSDGDLPSISPEQAAAFMRVDRQVMDTGLPLLRVVEQLTLADGRTVWLETSKFPLRASDGQVIGVIGSWEDVTERRQAERALRESEARHRALADSIPQIVWTTRPDGGVEYFNRWALEYTGLGPEHRTRWNWERLIHADDLKRTHAAWEGVLQTGAPQDVEFRLLRADGEYRWHIARIVAIRDPSGAVVRWVGTCTDIHDRKKASEQLARDAQILAGVRDSVIVTDLAGIVLYWNEGATRLFGWTAEEMVGRSCVEHYPEPHRAQMVRQIQEQAAGEDWDGEYEAWRKDGSRVWIDARVRRFDRPDGTPAGILGLSYDITERKRLEDQFRQAQKMEAVGRLAGGIAHDFNNLLTVINGYGDLLLSETALGDLAHEALTAIRGAGERASALTAQLLAFSRKALVAPRVLDLNEVVARSEKLLRRLIGEDILLTAQLAPAPCRLVADPNQVEQVLMNLAVNARDAMPMGGRLTIATGRVRAPDILTESGQLPPGPYVELQVRDTGCGMSDEVKTRLFEPFFTTKGPGKGTGLGLAVVHGVVKQAGGHVAAESTVGAGTTFRILFPESPAPAPDAGPSPISAPRKGTETILLVEDEDAVRALCRVILESHGYAVLAAEGGHEALTAVAAHKGPIHLLVTDVVMPVMSGRVLADTIRERLPGVRVLFVSGYTEDAVVRHGVREATDAFLLKPFTPQEFARKVRNVLDGGA